MRGNNIDVELIPEPELLVGQSVSTKDLRLGLLSEGPFREGEVPSKTHLKIGIVGDSDTIGKAKKLIKSGKNGVSSDNPDALVNYPPFPKFESDSVWRCNLLVKDKWTSEITSGEIERTSEIEEIEERIGYIVERYHENMKKLAKQQDSPDVIICAIPDEVDKNCGKKLNLKGKKYLQDRGEVKKVEASSQHDLFEFTNDKGPERAWNLRRALKIKAMELDTPIQLLRDETLSSTNRRSSKAWNIFSALYYKAGGVPWRMQKRDPNTCYVGLSFYRDQKAQEEYLRTAIAQMFTPGGNSLVLEGGTAVKDDKIPHLDYEKAKNLVKNCIEGFKDHNEGKYPSRLVLHKKGPYGDEEIEGFKDAIKGKVRKKDFLSIGPSKIRLLRNGRYPVPRGLLMKTPNEMHLYTTGYLPEKGTYPGSRIPQPIIVRLRETDTDYQTLAEELLEMSKLSWNNSNFCTREPITTEFSRKVGRILSEMDDKSAMKDDFRYYM